METVTLKPHLKCRLCAENGINVVCKNGTGLGAHMQVHHPKEKYVKGQSGIETNESLTSIKVKNGIQKTKRPYTRRTKEVKAAEHLASALLQNNYEEVQIVQTVDIITNIKVPKGVRVVARKPNGE